MTERAKILENLSPIGLAVWGIIRTLAGLNKYEDKNNCIIMEKKDLYVAPAVRFMDVRFECNFLTSFNGGGIDDSGEEDDWGNL